MTRNRKVATDVLRREYIYSDPPISISDLAEKYALARSGVAEKAQRGDLIEGVQVSWYQQREDFRSRLTAKVEDALREKWAEAETEYREKLLKAGGQYLDKYVTALEAGEIGVNTKDMLGIAAMMRTLMADQKAQAPQTVIVDGDGEELDEDDARKVLAEAKRLLTGGESD